MGRLLLRLRKPELPGLYEVCCESDPGTVGRFTCRPENGHEAYSGPDRGSPVVSKTYRYNAISKFPLITWSVCIVHRVYHTYVSMWKAQQDIIHYVLFFPFHLA